jgi:23S rRNA (uracil1939-C5)-methyltransferase
VLVPFSLPGELVQVEPADARHHVKRGKIASVLEPSPERIDPACPYFIQCGGCSYQHSSYAYEVSQKVEVLREVMERVGKFEAPAELPVITGPDWGYRNRIQLHFDGDKMGFHEGNSHEVVDAEQCPISSPKLNEAMGVLRGHLKERRWPWFLKSLELFTNEELVQVNVLDAGDKRLAKSFFDWIGLDLPGATEPSLEYGEFRVSHRSFFQTNRFLIDQLVETALEGAEGTTAWDLYSGVGLFSLALARREFDVTAVEASMSAVSDLGHNMERAGFHIPTYKASAELWMEEQTEAPDFVLADPPRSGLGKNGARALARLKPRQLTIVSCDPSTLARDLATLRSVGYEIESMTMVDMFPHTSHIETVTKLRIG